LCTNFITFNKNITFYKVVSENIFTDSENLNSSIIIFKSNTNISKYKIETKCNHIFEYLWEKNRLYLFNFKLLDNKCENPKFYLSDWNKKIESTNFELNIEKKSDIFLNFVDYSNEELLKINQKLLSEITKYSKYKKINKSSLSKIKKNRYYKELIYKKNILKNILERRSKKYENPVKWYYIATWLNVIPNAGRPYRRNYSFCYWWLSNY